MKISQKKTITKEVEVPSYWKYGPTFAAVVSEGVVIQVCNMSTGHSEAAVFTFLSDVEWEESNNAEFVSAYCTAINRISEASGIQHLPLQMELIDNTQNPES